MLKFLNRFFTLMRDEQGLIKDGQTVYPDDETKEGEDDPEKKKSDLEDKESPEKDEDSATGDDDKSKTGEEGSPEKDEDDSAAGQGKYGEFGDNADDVWTAHKNLTEKQTATQNNLANLRRALDDAGIVINKGEDDKISFGMKEGSKEEVSEGKFTAEHRKKLSGYFEDDTSGNSFVELIALLAEDAVTKGFTNQKNMSARQKKAVDQYLATKQEANSILDEMYPELNPGDVKKFNATGKSTNAKFNKVFYDRATEIWGQKYRGKDPYGELKAAREAAKELQVELKRSGDAEKKGFEKGRSGKKIVGPVDSSSDQSEGGSKITKQEYLNMSEEERETHDKKRF